MARLLRSTLLLVFLSSALSAQVKTVRGVVTSSEDGGPVPGVAVMEKGTTNATITNANGSYELMLSTDPAVLVVTGMGYSSKEVSVTSGTMNISLSAGSEQLDEVVVTALGQERSKRALGYGVETIDGSIVRETGESNVVQTMAGKLSGVQVIQSSGAAGAASFIRIRGNATFTQNNQPLFVIDGVPIDNSQSLTEDLRAGVALSNRAIDINPDDIENISVLKGGAAAALYGTRGANGVILITTKKGSLNSGFKVNFNSSMEITQVNKLPAYQTDYAQGWGGAYYAPSTGWFGSWGPRISDLGFDASGEITDDPAAMVAGSQGTVPSFNNPENFFQNGLRVNNSLSFTGGNDRSSFYFSLSDLRDQGVVPLNNFSRTSARLSASSNVTDNLKVGGSLAFTTSGGRRIQQGSNLSGLMLGLMRTPASFDNSNGATDPEDESAYINPDGSQRNYRGSGGYDNPYWTINRNPFEDNVNRVFGYVNFQYLPYEWLTLNYKVGVDNYSDRRKQIISIGSRTVPAGRIMEDVYNYTEFNHDLTARMNKKWGKLDGSLLLGFNANQRNLNNLYGQGDGLVINDFYNMSNAATQLVSQGIDRRRISGVYGEATLGYAEQLYLTLTARRDQASTFGDVGESIFYPSASLGYVFSDYLKEATGGLDWLSYGKLRASWAKVGIEPGFGTNATYFTQSQAGSGWINGLDFPFLGQAGFTQSNTIGSSDLRPEFTTTTEFGFDLGFMDNRIGLEFTSYNQQSQDLLVAVPIAASSGYTNRWLNAGTMENKGIEVVLNITPVVTDDLRWDISTNFTRNRNKVLELAPGVDVISLDWGFFGANQRLVAGEAYGTLYGDDWARDDAGNALVDENGYPIYSSTEVVVGDPNPDYIMGINNTVSWKNWTFDMLWDIREGGDIWNGTRGALYYFGTHKDVADGRGETFVWEDVVMGNSGVYAPGTPNAGQPNTSEIVRDETAYTTGPLSGFTGASRPFIEDGSWIRLRQVGITYTFDDDAFKNTFIKGLSLYAQGRNLLLITDYQGIDPETNLSGSTNSQGADYFNMPNTRGYLFGLRANF